MVNIRKYIIITDELLDFLGNEFNNPNYSKNSNMTFEQYISCWKNGTLEKFTNSKNK